MRRSWATFATAALAVLALAGCVGIPSSGGVHDGDIIDEQANPDFIVLPDDPTPGSTQQQILEDFMQAVQSPQNGYDIARKFLSPDLASTWKPDASTLIRSSAPSIASGGEDALTYSVTSKAEVDDAGNYRELRDPTSQKLSFSFAQVKGEWRISQAADGIVLSESSFAVAFRREVLYFLDPSYGYLVPDVRWFPSTARSPLRTVQALLLGPSPWLAQVVNTAFPEATEVGDNSVVVASGTATVDLSTEALNSTPAQRDRMRQQLAATLQTQNIQLTVPGVEFVIPSGAATRAVVNPGVDNAVLVGSDASFGPDGGSGIAALAGLSAAVVGAGAVAATLSTDKQVIALLSGDGGVYIARAGEPTATLIDDRPGLVAPSVDPFRFVWSAQGASAASLTTFDGEGDPHDLVSGLPADASIVSMDVSRDGTRLLLYLSTPAGPTLSVYGIIRDKNVPVGLGELFTLPVGQQQPTDATWVNDSTVATISASGEITVFEIGGPSLALGQLDGAVTIVGGNGGTGGLRVLTNTGELWRPQGSGWANTGISASFLATRQ